MSPSHRPVVGLVALLLLPLFGAAAASKPAQGPLRIHPENSRYFTDGTKRPDGSLIAVYLTGSHTWANLIDRGPADPPPAFDFAAYLDLLEQHHHNFIRLWGRQVGVSNEGQDSSREWQYHLIRFIHEYEAGKAKQHPVGMIAVGSGDAESNRALSASPAEWISPHTDAWGGVRNVPAANGAKVSLLDSDHWFLVDLYNNPALGREWVWKAFCRGHNPILMEHLPPQSMVLKDCPLTPDDTGYVASRRAMGQTWGLAARMNLAAMSPRGDLASSGYCLADPGKEYCVYVSGGGEVTVDLSAASGPLAVEWIRPVEGTVTSREPIAGGAKRSLRIPFAGDAVLHLRTQKSGPEARHGHEASFLEGLATALEPAPWTASADHFEK